MTSSFHEARPLDTNFGDRPTSLKLRSRGERLPAHDSVRQRTKSETPGGESLAARALTGKSVGLVENQGVPCAEPSSKQLSLVQKQ